MKAEIDVTPGSLRRLVELDPLYRAKSMSEAEAALDAEIEKARERLHRELHDWVLWIEPEEPVDDPRDAEETLTERGEGAHRFIGVVAVYDADIGDSFVFRNRLAAYVRRQASQMINGDVDGSCSRVEACILDVGTHTNVIVDRITEAATS
jgi:hypothetical protein